MKEVQQLESLANALTQVKTAQEKNRILDAFMPMEQHPLSSFFTKLQPEEVCCLKQLIAICQVPNQPAPEEGELRALVKDLVSIDLFYREMGGIVGYQLAVLRLLQREHLDWQGANFLSPAWVDISKENQETCAKIEEGLMASPSFCEIYPLGGAADRLHLIDERSGGELPAAKLEFAGKTLLEGLLKDLESREYLYFKRTGRVLTTPVAIMTSREKDNWIHVQDILEKNRWFGRPKESFRLFVQPLVPVVNEKGEWHWGSSWQPLLKPGGHGAIWKLAQNHGIFDWLKSLGVEYALIRQINNPLAGIDYGLLAFMGIGVSRKMSFGFASCPRRCLSAEGMNVLIEHKQDEGYSYVITNIEYCDFEKYGIEDRPLCENEPYSRFTSNTNILFANLAALEQAVQQRPFSSFLINFKKDASGKSFGRLESMMQNIADVFVEERKTPLGQEELKKTFVTYNKRYKTISTAKKAFTSNGLTSETPENCFYDLMQAHRELLADVCQFVLPSERSLDLVLSSHPPFVFLMHPALGPLFRSIGQKIRGGRLGEGSEFNLQIADTELEGLEVEGSLRIEAAQPLGGERFASSLARCVLKQVQVVNRGVDWEHSKPFWKGRYRRWESLSIFLEGRSEFIAEGVCFKGDQQFIVRDGERLIVSQKGEALYVMSEAIS